MSTRPFPPPPAPVEGEKNPTFTKKTIKIKTPHSATEYTVAFIDEKKYDRAKGEIILLHGLLTTSAAFNKLIPLLLDEGYRVIAPDLPGCGGSTEEKLWADMDDKADTKPHGVIEKLGDVEIRGGWEEAGHWLHAFLQAVEVWTAKFWTCDLGAPFVLGMHYLLPEFQAQEEEARKKSQAGDTEAWQKYMRNRPRPVTIDGIVCQSVPRHGTPLRDWWGPIDKGAKGVIGKIKKWWAPDDADLETLFGIEALKGVYGSIPGAADLAKRDHDDIEKLKAHTHHRIVRLFHAHTTKDNKGDWGLPDWAAASQVQLISILPADDLLYDFGAKGPCLEWRLEHTPRAVLETYITELIYRYIEHLVNGEWLAENRTPSYAYAKETMEVDVPGSGRLKVSYIDQAPTGTRLQPVLLLHGLLGSSMEFAPAIPILTAHGHRVIAPDLPGCGGSDDGGLWAPIKTWEDRAKWLDAFVKSINPNNETFALLLTADMGAPIAKPYLKTLFAENRRTFEFLFAQNCPPLDTCLDLDFWNAVDPTATDNDDNKLPCGMFTPNLKAAYLKYVPEKVVDIVNLAGQAGRVWVRDHADNFATAARAATQKEIMQRYLELAPRSSDTTRNQWGYNQTTYKRKMGDGGVVEWGSMHGLNVRSDRARWDGLYHYSESPGQFGHIGVPLSTVWEQTGRPMMETHAKDVTDWVFNLTGNTRNAWRKWTAQMQANVEHWEQKNYNDKPSHFRGDPYVF